MSYAFTATLWRHPGESGWHFLTLPGELAAEISEDTAAFRRGFGSIKVEATVSGHNWSTSLFPDSRSGTYLLPVKKTIRSAAGLETGDQVAVHLEVPESG